MSLLTGLAFLASAACAEKSQAEDQQRQLIQAPGDYLVQGHCSACHSLALVVAQRGDRRFWLKIIRTMQAEHNLWQLPAAHEQAIVDYLAEHYSETQWGRRPGLPVHLLPGR